MEKRGKVTASMAESARGGWMERWTVEVEAVERCFGNGQIDELRVEVAKDLGSG